MKKFIIATCMMMLLGLSNVCAQQGKQAFGFGFGYGTEIESLGIGVKYQYNITNELRLEPSFDYYFKNDGLSMFDFNANVHYLCPVSRSVKLYPLAGLTYTNWRWDAYDGYNLTKGKFGINLGAGVEFALDTNWTMNFEMRYQLISDFDQGVLNFGVAYSF